MAADPGPGADLARFYDLDLVDYADDIELYLALAGRGRQSILELGCGSGRVAIPLALAGNEVVGVDNDPAMLARARTAWAAASGPVGSSLELSEGDIAELDLGRKFNLVILGLNLLPLLGGRQAQANALAVAARHLDKKTGRVAIDLALPSSAELDSWDGTLSLAWQRPDPKTGDIVAKIWSVDYDHATQVAVVTTYFDTWPSSGGAVTRVARRDELYLTGAGELLGLIDGAGLRVDHAGGDYAMDEFGPGSERIVVVCSLL